MKNNSHLKLPPLSESIQYFDSAFRQKTLTENPSLLFSMIRVLEISIKAGLTPLILSSGNSPEHVEEVCCRYGEFLLNGNSDKRTCIDAGKHSLIAYTEAEWSVLFARDKLTLSDLGFISTKDGDLRTAKLLSSPEQVLNLLRWKQFRERPECLQHIMAAVIKKGGPYAKKFYRRLGETVEKAPFNFADNVPDCMRTNHRDLQMFLLDKWVSEWSVTKDSPSQKLPPLYTIQSKAMFDLLFELANKAGELNRNVAFRSVGEMDETSFSMVWRRLGLRKDDSASWSHVEWERSRRNLWKTKKLILWDKKPSHA